MSSGPQDSQLSTVNPYAIIPLNSTYTHCMKKINEVAVRRQVKVYLGTIAAPVTIVKFFTDCEYKVSAGVLPTAVTHS